MKQVIKGKRYDTETAKYITEISSREQGIGPSDFRYWEETLYMKRTGEFFLFGEGGPMTKYRKPYENNGWQSGYKIVPLTLEEAQEWAEQAMDADEYEAIFGPVEEEDGEFVNHSTYKMIKWLAEQNKK